MEYKGIEYLRKKLSQKRSRVLLRYSYYEMKNGMTYYSKLMPKGYEWMSCTLGWSAKAVDALADRLIFNTFRSDNFNINKIFEMNNPDVFFDSAILSALISACCFVYISQDENGFPRLQVIDGSNATGIIDPITGLLTEGYAVLERDTVGAPMLEAYFTAGLTTYYPKHKSPYAFTNAAPAPLLVPIIYRPDAKRPFGHSRITRAGMSLQQAAMRTLKRSEITAEFYSFPQKYVLGLSEETEFDKDQATYSSFLRISEDEQGNKPTLGQFSQATMQPHIEQLRMFASCFAGETGLTLDDLGFVSDNPSSADAIKSSHEMLRLTARKAQRTIGSGFLNVGYLSACVRDNFPYLRKQVYLTSPAWKPIFEPDSAQLGRIGDALYKIQQVRPEYITDAMLDDLLGLG